MPPLRALASGLLAALLSSSSASAHDYWLEFSPQAPAAGDRLALTLWVGEDFAAEAEKAMQRARTVALRQITALGELDLLAQADDGATPFLTVHLGGTGGYLFGVERDLARIELPPLKFNRYLRHEGLDRALVARKRAGERFQPARERYTRYLKSFVRVGDAVDGVSTRVLGHRLEIVPERDLAAVRPGDRVTLRLQFEGRPLAGVRVDAFARASGRRAGGQAAVTDSDGRVVFTLDRAGPWLVRTVHMQRCTGCGDAEWESFWTSYSFAVR